MLIQAYPPQTKLNPFSKIDLQNVKKGCYQYAAIIILLFSIRIVVCHHNSDSQLAAAAIIFTFKTTNFQIMHTFNFNSIVGTFRYHFFIVIGLTFRKALDCIHHLLVLIFIKTDAKNTFKNTLNTKLEVN